MFNKRLKTLKDILPMARQGKYAVAQININNLEWTKSALNTAQECNSPIILGVSEGAKKYMGGFEAITGMVLGMIDFYKITIPVILHLDHGTTYEVVEEAIKGGFSSVMFDGSKRNIEENLEISKKVVALAMEHGVSVEAEVGSVGGEEDGVVGGIRYASLDECKRMAALGVDALAASLGSVHGHYEGEAKLGFEEMKEYSKATGLPLVLHGGSGIADDLIKKAISCGESKINVNTEIQEAFCDALVVYFESEKYKIGKGYDPRNIMKPGLIAMNNAIENKLKLFGSTGKA